MFDSLLEVDQGYNIPGVSSASLVAFADDAAVVATGRNTPILKEVTV